MNKIFDQVVESASDVVLDKGPELKLALTCILAGGHLLIEDVPGVGKTTLVQTLGKLLGLETRRIQFTVDLLPADILGSQIFHPEQRSFEFHKGPIFSELVMTDELNRASPRTQSALLQAMEEGQVSIDGQTWNLPEPFHVIATQNPHQQMGTFHLPESQLDRFLMSLELSYASTSTEIHLFQNLDPRIKMKELRPLLSAQEILKVQGEIMKSRVSEKVAQYVGVLLENSRRPEFPGMNLSTRAGLALIRAGKAWAFLDQRDHLRPEDIQAVLKSVLSHRLGGNHGLRKGAEWSALLQSESHVPI